ncbi:hypothetical protein [Methyloversatilis thermotolerans]|uniref:hypothetical protein n=1 Tax=Methyloversatilis thermotolerans TaxID=1346290 RepID=UPI000362D1C9|nr:hypothetical protein [Methyloversatilis thermotolerans]
MSYSVQQIKFECFSYIKEFGARMEDWSIGVADDPEHALFGLCGVHPERDIWLWKPALSPHAARAVYEFMISRYRLHPAPASSASSAGRCVFMYRRMG